MRVLQTQKLKATILTFEGGDGQADLLTPVVIIVFNFYEHILESLEKKYFMSLIFICLEPGIGF